MKKYPDAKERVSFRITKNEGRVIVIESVFGITKLPPYLTEEEFRRSSRYLVLDQEQQRKANIYLDYFFNRILMYNKNPEKKVNVPCNFNTPNRWKSIFESVGFTQIEFKHLGIDLPIVPEYHTLHVLKVKK